MIDVYFTYSANCLSKGIPVDFLDQFGHERASTRHGWILIEIIPSVYYELEWEVDNAGCLADALIAN